MLGNNKFFVLQDIEYVTSLQTLHNGILKRFFWSEDSDEYAFASFSPLSCVSIKLRLNVLLLLRTPAVVFRFTGFSRLSKSFSQLTLTFFCSLLIVATETVQFFVISPRF